MSSSKKLTEFGHPLVPEFQKVRDLLPEIKHPPIDFKISSSYYKLRPIDSSIRYNYLEGMIHGSINVYDYPAQCTGRILPKFNYSGFFNWQHIASTIQALKTVTKKNFDIEHLREAYNYYLKYQKAQSFEDYLLNYFNNDSTIYYKSVLRDMYPLHFVFQTVLGVRSFTKTNYKAGKMYMYMIKSTDFLRLHTLTEREVFDLFVQEHKRMSDG